MKTAASNPPEEGQDQAAWTSITGEGEEGEGLWGPSSEEWRHLEEVVRSFREYSKFSNLEVQRRWRHLQALPAEQAHRLPKDALAPKMAKLTEAIRHNQAFLDCVVGQVTDIVDAQDLLESTYIDPFSPDVLTSVSNISKIRATLHSCVREWAREGAFEREQCFTPILEEIRRYLVLPRPGEDLIQPQPPKRVLIPGAGAGRLALEVVALGCSCQGNEFSYHMLLTSNYLLNHIEMGRAESMSIFPFLEQTCNVVDAGDPLREVRIPDVVPHELLLAGRGGGGRMEPEFSMTSGEFLEVYQDQAACWDAVVTCFFLDTAPVVLDYIDTIHRLLKPGAYIDDDDDGNKGGIWVNFGPLLYHWANTSPGSFLEAATSTRTSSRSSKSQQACKEEPQPDGRYLRSVELSWSEIRHVMVHPPYSFRLAREEMRDNCTYAANMRSMMTTRYNCLFFTAIKE